MLLGDKIPRANHKIAALTSDVTLALGMSIVETPRKAGLSWVDELKDYLRVPAAGAALIRSPYPHTLFFGYRNGVPGYMPTKREFPGQGYEIGVTPFTEQAEEDFTQGVVAHIRGMPR